MSSKSNDAGQGFQTRLESIFAGYRKAGIADIEKIDPPVKIMGGGKFRRVIFMENPWLDFGGTWSQQGGRAIFIEAKSTEKDRLSLGSGVSDNQIKALRRWTKSGAVAGVAWLHSNQIKIIPAIELLSAWDAGAKSIRWQHLPAVERGLGLIEFDILGALAERY